MNELICHLHHDPPHILGLTEHHLHHNELASLHIENYTLGTYYCRKSKHKGGVCMFVHNSIKLTSLNIDSYCVVSRRGHIIDVVLSVEVGFEPRVKSGERQTVYSDK